MRLAGANDQGRATLSYSVAPMFQSTAPHQKVEKVTSDSLVTFFVSRIRLNRIAPGIVEGWARAASFSKTKDSMRNFCASGLHSSSGATAIFAMGKNLAPFFCSVYYASRATEKAGTMALPTPSLTKFVVLELQLITVLADRPLHSVIETAGCFSLDLQRHTNFHPKPLREQHQDLLGYVRKL
jgi:hypothetical protein